MAKIKELFYFQRLLYTRALQGNRAKKAEKMFVAWLMLVIFIRYLANTGFAISTLLEGKISVGIPMIEFNLFHLLLIWILIPPVVTGTAGIESFLASLCRQFPLTKNEIFFTGLYGIVIQPVFWLSGILSLVGLAPLLFLKAGITRLAAGLSFVCFCITLGIFFSFLFVIISNRFRLSGIVSPLFKIVLIMILLANFSFYWGNDVVVYIFNHPFVLSSPQGNPSILSTLSFLHPSPSIADHGYLFRSAGIIIIFLFLSFLLIFCSFLVSNGLTSPHGIEQKKKTLFRVFHSLRKKVKWDCTSLLLKEIKSLFCTIDVKMSVCIVLIFIIYLFQTSAINQVLSGFITAVIVILHASFFFNSFGLDHQAIDRYHLFPVSPKKIITAKNAAALIVVSVQLFPLFLINLIKSQNMLLTGYYLLVTMNIMLVYCLAGNITSLFLAQPRKYSHFGETGDSGSGRTFFAALCWGIPLYMNNALEGDLIRGTQIYAFVLIVLLALFFVLREKIGLLFIERKEEMRRNLL